MRLELQQFDGYVIPTHPITSCLTGHWATRQKDQFGFFGLFQSNSTRGADSLYKFHTIHVKFSKRVSHDVPAFIIYNFRCFLSACP